MDAVELLLWLLLVAVALVAMGLASFACMGERDAQETPTSATQNVSTSKSVAEELFSPNERIRRPSSGKRSSQIVGATPVYYVPTTAQR